MRLVFSSSRAWEGKYHYFTMSPKNRAAEMCDCKASIAGTLTVALQFPHSIETEDVPVHASEQGKGEYPRC